MRNRISIIILAVFYILNSAFSQNNYDFKIESVTKRITDDIAVLASDSLMGREAGTGYEQMACDYIINKFKEAGIPPYFGDTSYLQKFTFNDSPFAAPENKLIVNNKSYKLYHDFYPISYSDNDTVIANTVNVGYGIDAPEKDYSDYKNLTLLKNKIFVIKLGLPKEYRSNEDFYQYGKKNYKIKKAIEKGAVGIIFILASEEDDDPTPVLESNVSSLNVPILFVKEKSIFKEDNLPVSMAVCIDRQTKRTAYNVGGFINNNSKQTIIIGGHYDHLGMGFFGSRKNGEYEIHNGADDNASGTAGVIELARRLKNSDLKNYNFLFLCFSGEEKGLYGSYFFASSQDFNKLSVNCMINLDMIGKLGKKNKLKIFGSGTSPQWKLILNKSNDKSLKIIQIKSPTDGSDHMAFYYKKIPDIFVHTGLHRDYHTPDDDIDKINYVGEAKILEYVYKVIQTLNTLTPLQFRETTKWNMIMGLRHMLM